MWDKAIREFIQYLRFERKYSPHTQAAYQKDLEQFADFIGYESLDSLWPDLPHSSALRTWMAELSQSGMVATTINRKMASLRAFFKFILSEDPSRQNPAQALFTLKTPKRLPSFIQEQAITQLLEEMEWGDRYTDTLNHLLLSMLYDTGMRREELLSLRLRDIDWSLAQIRVRGKGNKERLIPLSHAQLDQIRTYLTIRTHPSKKESENLLFVLETGRPVYAQYVYRLVRTSVAQVSTVEKRSPHVMRHSFATHLLQNGANIQAIKDLLGHSSLAATQIYTHNQIEQLKNIHKKNHPRG